MQATHLATTPVRLSNYLVRCIVREGYLSWRFIVRDISATVMPAVIFMIAAWHSHSAAPMEFLIAVGYGALYFWHYIYSFCLSNQIVGIEEDRINKPDRPLPSGEVTLKGALVRWVVVMISYTLVGWWLDVLLWTLLWQVVTVLHNFGGWAKRWYTKNLVMSLGTIAQLAAAWQMVAPITPTAWRWILLPTVAIFLLISTQDFRDITGDRVTGRSTLPLAFGEETARWLLGLSWLFFPAIIYVTVKLPADYSIAVVITMLAQTIMCATIGVRLILYRTPKADHQTYMLFTYWYCVFLASAIVVI